MVFQSGFNSNAKIVKYRLSPDEGDEQLYALTPRQIKALLSNTDYLSWMNRHSSFPPDINTKDELEAWVSNLNLKLMTPLDFCQLMIDNASCFLESETTRDVLRQTIMNDPEFNEFYEAKNRPLTESELTGQMNGTITSASLDILWAQCLEIVDYSHKAILDLFQILEVQSNNVELIENLNTIPFAKVIFLAIPVTDFVEFANYFQEAIIEQYEAQWTETVPDGTLYILACKIFCLCKVDGKITVERIFDAILDLFNDYFTPSYNNLSEIVETILGVNDDSAIVVWGAFFALWGVARLSSVLGLSNVNIKALGYILELAEDNASDDHEVICVECTTPSTDICFDFTADDETWTPIVNNTVFAQYVTGGWGAGTDGSSFAIEKLITGVTITKVTVTFNAPVKNLRLYIHTSFGFTFVTDLSTANVEVHVFDNLTITNGLGVWLNSAEIGSAKCIEVCYEIDDG